MPFRLKAPFETGVTSTGHRVENGTCVVDTAEQAAYMAGPPFNFQILGETVEAANEQPDAGETAEEAPSPPLPEQELAKPAPRKRK